MGDLERSWAAFHALGLARRLHSMTGPGGLRMLLCPTADRFRLGGNGSRRTCCSVAAGSSLACPRCFLALLLLALPADSAGHGLALRPVSQCDLGRRDRGG